MFKKSLFTLVEILISVLIISILIWLIYKLFLLLNDLNIKFQLESKINNEVLYFSQVFQNIADTKYIDYDKYPDLALNSWFVDIFYFTGDGSWWYITLSWDCNAGDWKQIRNKSCFVLLNYDWKNYVLTTGVYFSWLVFRILPFKDPNKFFLSYEDLFVPSVFVNAKVYSNSYNPFDRRYNILLDYHNIFIFKKY